MNLLLLSGGLDSSAIAVLYRSNVDAAVSFDYGQANIREVEYAERLCGRLRLPWVLQRLPQFRCQDGRSHIYRGRNVALLSVAVAANPLAQSVWIGANADDAAEYLDCRDEYLTRAEDLLGVKVVRPLIGLSKRSILEAVKDRLSPDDTYSCYEGTDPPCGRCAACERNIDALLPG